MDASRTRAAIVILSMHDDVETRTRALAAGAAGFVSKHESATVLLQAIRDVAQTHARTMRDFGVVLISVHAQE